MTEAKSLTGARIRLYWGGLDGAEEKGRDIARVALRWDREDQEDEVRDLLRRHIANAYDGCTPDDFAAYLHGVMNELVIATERAKGVHRTALQVNHLVQQNKVKSNW